MPDEKITYLLGAGASLEAFPLVKSVKGKHNDFNLATDISQTGDNLKKSKNRSESGKIRAKLGDILVRVGTEADRFGNIDTYAKYLYHTKKFDSLKDLKLAVIFYFTWKQIVGKKCDKRYLHFLTSIIDDKHKFPSHVKVITWNYDYQLEIAAHYYDIPLFCQFPHSGYTTDLCKPDDRYSVVHCNSIAGLYFYREKNPRIAGADYVGNIIEDIRTEKANRKTNSIETEFFLKEFQEKYLEKQPLLTFAWEKKSREKDILNDLTGLVHNMIEGSTILVVIGYSFPFYNREVDNEIFKILKKSVKKIYFQDPSVDGELLRKRYDLRHPDHKIDYSMLGGIKVQETPPVQIEHIVNCE